MSETLLLNGECVETMRGFGDATVDAVVCDPPYHLTSIVERFGKPDAAPSKVPEGGTGVYARTSRGFMGQTWDGGDVAFRAETWREVLRVLKPGGYLLAFSGTRTYHRMTVAIEDAGFEIRDCLSWQYGCLSDDSEALTRRGWVRGPELRDTDDVLQWEATTGAFAWARPSRIVVAPYAGPLVRLANRHTDQLLTPNHRVYARVQRHTRHAPATDYEVLDAEAVGNRSSAWRVTLPVAAQLREGEAVDADYAYLVGWWLTDAWAHGDGRACMFSQSKPETLARLREALAPYGASEYVKPPRKPEHAEEHTFYLTGPLATRLLTEHPERRLTWDVLGWGWDARHALYRGLMDGDGSQPSRQHAHTFWSKNAERRDVFLALAVSLGYRAFIGAKDCVYVNTDTDTTEVQGRHRAAPVDYDGLVWCVTVPTGAFLARRNGRPFITGNSGFPKSLAVDKAIDKIDRSEAVLSRARTFTAWMRSTGITAQQVNDATGTSMGHHYTTHPTQPAVATADLFDLLRPLLPPVPEEIEELVRSRTVESENMKRRAVIGEHKGTSPGCNMRTGMLGGDKDAVGVVTAPATDAARRWAGFGTSLKPAWEPIVVARKPLEGTVAGNVLKYGTGAMNIDGCRVAASEGDDFTKAWDRPVSTNIGASGGAYITTGEQHTVDLSANKPTGGRWPANVLLSCPPDCDGDAHAPGCPCAALDAQSGARTSGVMTGLQQGFGKHGIYGKSGLTPAVSYGDTGGASRFFNRLPIEADDLVPFLYAAKASRSERNAGMPEGSTCTHPTVKPVSVMRHLVRLVTPPGGLVLDPFMGSGTTGIAAVREGFDFVGIEMSPEYLAIAEARIGHAKGKG